MLIETFSNTSKEHFREYGEGLREESTMAVFENAITKPNTSYMLTKALFINKIKCNIKGERKKVPPDSGEKQRWCGTGTVELWRSGCLLELF